MPLQRRNIKKQYELNPLQVVQLTRIYQPAYPRFADELQDATPDDIHNGAIAEWIENIPIRYFTIQWTNGDETGYFTKNNSIPNDEWWASGAWYHLMRGSDETVFSQSGFEGPKSTSLQWNPAFEIKEAREVELLADGIDHCIFKPLKEFYVSKLEGASKSGTEKLQNNIRKCEKLAEKYKKGIPYDALIKELGPMETTVHIVRADKRATMILNGGQRWKFQFLHTRWNHVDVMLADSSPTTVGIPEMRSILKQLIEDKTPFTYEGTPDLPRNIETAIAKYRCEFPYDAVFDSLNEKIGRKYMKIDFKSERPLWDFINCAIRQNNHVKFQDIPEGVKEVDCVRGYTQFKRSAWYRGFLGAVWDWVDEVTMEDVRRFIGIYKVKILTVVPFIQMVGGLYPGKSVVMISPMIEMFVDKGWITCEVQYGIYGSKFHFDFPEEFYQKYDSSTGLLGDKGVPLYSLWSGMTNHASENRIIRHCTDYKLCVDMVNQGENIRWEYDSSCYENVRIDGVNMRRLREEVKDMKNPPGCGVQYIALERYDNSPQIFAFISNYMRMIMLDEMSKISLIDLFACKLDSIVYRGNYQFSEIFREKECLKTSFPMSVNMFNSCTFDKGEVVCNDLFAGGLYAGAGGSGKSHKASRIRKLLYSAPMWSANVDFRNKYGGWATTPHQILGIGCPKMLEEPGAWLPSTIFWDEATMLPPDHLQRCKELSPHIRQIFGGDFDKLGRPFQTIMDGGYLDVRSMDRIEFLEDYRSGCDLLRRLKVELRNIMFKNYGNVKLLLDYCKSRLRIVDKSFVKSNYTVDDWILCGPNKICDEWTLEFKDLKKYRVIVQKKTELCKALKGEKAVLKGDIVFEDMGKNTELRHGYTIHSVQGRTIRTKIFIDTRGISFNYCLLYTAISRAVKLDQLFLIV